MRFLAVFLAVSVMAVDAHAQRRNRDPVIERAPEGGQLICDPHDGAAGYQPPGQRIWALNWQARARIGRTNRLFIEIPTSARAALDQADFDSLRRRAESLCR